MILKSNIKNSSVEALVRKNPKGQDLIVKRFLEYKALPANDLAKLAEDPTLTLEDRVIAASVLTGVGDARIRCLDPEMVLVPAATVDIGLDAQAVDVTMDELQDTGIERDWIVKETPRHKVSIQSFKMAKYPVTNSEYHQFVHETGATEFPSEWSNGTFPEDKSNHPVCTTSPSSAERYCLWLSQKTGRKFRLPTEYEWEYAAAGPDGLEYPWGADFDESRANTIETGLGCTMPIGVFIDGLSPFGISDLAGNVEELLATEYVPYPGAAKVADQFFERNPNYRMTRGGAFNRHRDTARCRRRHGYYPDTQVIGFRLAETI